MLKKEFNRLEISINKPFETHFYNIPRGRYSLRVIHKCEAIYKRPTSLFFTFSIHGNEDAKTKQILGVKGFSAQYGIFSYAGGGSKLDDYYVQEIFLDVEQNISNLKIHLRTFFQNTDVFIDAFQIFNAEISSKEIYAENTNELFFKVEEVISFTEMLTDQAGISLKEINNVSLKSFNVNRDAPKKIILNDIDAGSYLLKITHQSKDVFEKYNSLFFTFSIPTLDSVNEVKDILGLSGISSQYGVFSHMGGGTFKDGKYHQDVLLKVSKPVASLQLVLKGLEETDVFIDELIFISKKDGANKNFETNKTYANHANFKNINDSYSIIKENGQAAFSLEKMTMMAFQLRMAQCYHLMDLDICTDKNLLDISLESHSEHEGKYKLLVLFESFDKNNNKVEKIPGMGVSLAFDKPFKYLIDQKSTDNKISIKTIKTTLPPEISRCEVYLAAVGLKNNQSVDIALEGKFTSYIEEKKMGEKSVSDELSQNREVKKIQRNNKQRFIKELNVACILDEFTTECLKHEVSLIAITQESWEEEIAAYKIDFLLVESCWRGNNGNWGTLTRGSGGGAKLSGILSYCKKHGIPTVFWNKEDPPHYDKFGPVARLFDHVITTDINMLPSYKKDYGIEAFPLSFAAQPKIHKPSSSIERLNKAVFAGSYYGDKPKRCTDFNLLMTKVQEANISYDIFDRNYERNIEKFEFPISYQENIKGCLPADEIWKAHQGYKYQINMNTVQNSHTMFARRVYESLASGTPVISNYSLGVKEKFGDIVLFSEGDDLVSRLIMLEKNPDKYLSLAKEGVRRVMREHTYAHRIQDICSLLDIDISIEQPRAVMVINVNNESQIERALNLYKEQTAFNKHLFIEMNNFESAHKFLNKSSENVSYSMGLSKSLYADLSKLYGSDIVLNMDVNQNIEKEALEDFSYWGLYK